MTIREGLRDFNKGKVIICCPEKEWSTEREITEIEHKKISSVTQDEAKKDGFNNTLELFEKLKEYYPSIDLNSLVTIIKWK